MYTQGDSQSENNIAALAPSGGTWAQRLSASHVLTELAMTGTIDVLMGRALTLRPESPDSNDYCDGTCAGDLTEP
eukprot:scaffold37937_cov37-Tisochrysis_lutea.AAC.3